MQGKLHSNFCVGAPPSGEEEGPEAERYEAVSPDYGARAVRLLRREGPVGVQRPQDGRGEGSNAHEDHYRRNDAKLELQVVPPIGSEGTAIDRGCPEPSSHEQEAKECRKSGPRQEWRRLAQPIYDPEAGTLRKR